ncbi:MAG: tetratricopeptide repeat protein [Sedimentisphaerales bacterium]|nr:tetratricopeptide repeat protein [Sedimentisphaerales bacterium]
MSRIITFYSYKGGVGRTMALANVAVLLAKRGKRVLMLDWDLEAPGLHRYFKDYLPEQRVGRGGLIHLLHKAKQDPQVKWEPYVGQVKIKDYQTISLISSGDHIKDYVERVRDFSWTNFFEKHSGGKILDCWRKKWKESFDFVLIDSRTGITDTGGVCTVFLPDILTFVFSANEQSFANGVKVVNGVQEARRKLDVPRSPVAVLPLPGRFDGRDEVDDAKHWLDRFARELKPFYDDWLPKRFDPLQILELTKVPYVAKFSFGEPLPVISHGVSNPEFPGFYLDNIAQLLATDFKAASQIVSPEDSMDEELKYSREISKLMDEELKNSREMSKLMDEGMNLYAEGKLAEVVALYDRLVARFGDAEELAIKKQVAMAIFNKGVVLERLKKPEEAIAAYDDMVGRFGDAGDLVLREQVAKAIFNKGVVLGRLEKPEEAIAAYDDMVGCFGDAGELVLRKRVARAILNKGVVLERLGKPEEAIAVYEDLVGRFGDAGDLVFREQVAKAIFNKGVVLWRLEKPEETIATYDDVVRRFGEAEELVLREVVAEAIFNKGGALRDMEKSEEAIATYGDLVGRFGDAGELVLRNQVAMAILNKGVVLGRSEKPEETIAVYKDFVRRFGDAGDLTLKEGVAQAINNLSSTLISEYHRAGEEAVLGRALDFARQAVILGKGHYNLGCVLALSGNTDEAFKELEGCLDRQEIEWSHIDGDPEGNIEPDRNWEGLRDHPRYLVLKAKYGNDDKNPEEGKREG